MAERRSGVYRQDTQKPERKDFETRIKRRRDAETEEECSEAIVLPSSFACKECIQSNYLLLCSY